LLEKSRIVNLVAEANELVAITVASIRTARNSSRPFRIPHSAFRNPQFSF
jgi:hypothetical protein